MYEWELFLGWVEIALKLTKSMTLVNDLVKDLIVLILSLSYIKGSVVYRILCYILFSLVLNSTCLIYGGIEGSGVKANNTLSRSWEK